MVWACFGSSMFAYCSRRLSIFQTLTEPEILRRRLFLTMKTRIAFGPDASLFGKSQRPTICRPRVGLPDICPPTLNLVWTSCESPSYGCGPSWMPCRRTSYSTAGPVWRCNSGIGFLKTLTSFHRLVLNRSDCGRGYPDLDPANPDTWVHHKRDNLEAFVNRDGPVKVAFFGGLDTLQRIQDPLRRLDLACAWRRWWI